MGQNMLLRNIFVNLFLKISDHTLVDNFWNRWCRFNDNRKNNIQECTLFTTMNEAPIYRNNSMMFYHTLYEIMLFNLDIMIDGFACLVWNFASPI